MVSFRIEQPGWVSVDYMLNTLETIGGLFFSDYLASVTAMAADLTGDAALAVKGGAKAVLSLLSFWGATQLNEEARDAAFFVSIGSAASIGMDLLDYIYGEVFAGPAGQAAKATLGQSPSARVSATAPTGEKKSSSSSSGSRA